VVAYHWRSLNDSFQGLTSRSMETGDCLLMAETRPSHCIKINVRYRETQASATDSNLTEWMFILNGNFSNKIDQVLMAFISQQGQRASSMGKV
jgi:hypothetical protein